MRLLCIESIIMDDGMQLFTKGKRYNGRKGTVKGADENKLYEVTHVLRSRNDGGRPHVIKYLGDDNALDEFFYKHFKEIAETLRVTLDEEDTDGKYSINGKDVSKEEAYRYFNQVKNAGINNVITYDGFKYIVKHIEHMGREKGFMAKEKQSYVELLEELED